MDFIYHYNIQLDIKYHETVLKIMKTKEFLKVWFCYFVHHLCKAELYCERTFGCLAWGEVSLLQWLNLKYVSFPWINLGGDCAPEVAPTGRFQASSVLPEGHNVGPSGGAVKMGPRVRVQLPDCSPQGGSDTLYSAVLTCEGHACMCFSVGSLNRLPMRVKLSRNLKLIWRGPHIHVCLSIRSADVCTRSPPYCICLLHTHMHGDAHRGHTSTSGGLNMHKMCNTIISSETQRFKCSHFCPTVI